MKRILFAAAFAVSAASVQAADVGVSISVGQPGFYGRIELGDYPQPQLVYRNPRVIQRVPAGRPPIYLHVPPGHERNWSRHCREYNACGERVYFVQNSWYDREYAPRYREQHGEGGMIVVTKNEANGMAAGIMAAVDKNGLSAILGYLDSSILQVCVRYRTDVISLYEYSVVLTQ